MSEVAARGSLSQPEMESATVLAVDDEPLVLSALARLLVPRGVRLLTATSGLEALRLLEEQAGSIGVLISDYAMPGTNGAELLHTVHERWPDVTRVLLTGNADLPTAARAVNEGHVSRLYTKPWDPDELRQAVAQALEQHRSLTEIRRLRAVAAEQAVRLEQWNQRLEGLVAERTSDLERANTRLQRSMLEIVRLLLTGLEQRLPRRAARCKEVARLAGRLAERAGMVEEDARRVQVAALVHDVGLTGLPDGILRRPTAELSMSARTTYQGHSALGQRMLSTVEDLGDMANWIRHHHERWDGRGYPDGLQGHAIPLPSRIISLADGYLEAAAFEPGAAPKWRSAQEMTGAFDPELVRLLGDELAGRSIDPSPQPAETNAPVRPARSPRSAPDDEVQTASVSVEALRTGMVIFDAVLTTSGTILLRAGERLTADHLQRIHQLHREGVLRTTVIDVVIGTLVTESAPPLVEG